MLDVRPRKGLNETVFFDDWAHVVPLPGYPKRSWRQMGLCSNAKKHPDIILSRVNAKIEFVRRATLRTALQDLELLLQQAMSLFRYEKSEHITIIV